MPGDEQLLPGTGTGHEEQAAFALQILLMRERILLSRCDDRCRWHEMLVHADDGDTPELHAFHAVHVPTPTSESVCFFASKAAETPAALSLATA